jgi:hypothetical protein
MVFGRGREDKVTVYIEWRPRDRGSARLCIVPAEKKCGSLLESLDLQGLAAFADQAEERL